jgi:oligoendopeptidase F
MSNTSTALPERHELAKEETWDLTNIYADVTAWEAAVSALPEKLTAIGSFKGRLAEGTAVLADYLSQAAEIQQAMSRIYLYPALEYSTNSNDQEAAGRYNRARSLYGQTMAATAFAQPEMLAIGAETLRQWQTEEPRLAPYAHYFDQLAQKAAHVRSAEVEQVLGLVSDPFGTASETHGVLANSELPFPKAIDSDGGEHEIAQTSINHLLHSADRALRQSAYEGYADTHLAFKNTMANALLAGVKQDVFMSRVRRYDSSLEAALGQNFIPTAVFHTLIETYKKNLPTWHKYWRIRKQALGLDSLYEYDIKAPLSQDSPVVDFATAVDWIANGMAPLGDNYVQTMRHGCLQERWVDYGRNKGKRMGAFSYGTQGTYPFIMMSYTPDLFGLSTLAHELGHSMHSYHTWQTQTILPYTRYGLFVAEVASNFNQAMVRDYLFHQFADNREYQIALIEEAMSNFHRYFFIMPTLARFELEIHERLEKGQALNADTLINLLADLFAEGYGDELVQERERIGITWAEFHTHLYSNFYVYQYATGISGAHALAHRILQAHAQGDPAPATAYLNFLKAGGSDYPLNILQQAGVDLTSPEPIETTFAILADLVDKLETLINQR